MGTIQDYMTEQLIQAYGRTQSPHHGLMQLLWWHTLQLEQFWLQLQEHDVETRINILLDVVFQMRME